MLLKRKINDLHDYITNIINPYTTERCGSDVPAC